ncbi:MAG: sugar-binding protein [Capsulimonadaceae bacterium]|nr:sugar-binding protein [Capsulimonadaceae bacterium]
MQFRCLVPLFAFALAVTALVPLHAATLTAETSRPNMSTFAIGEKVSVTFNAAGLAPSSTTMLSVVVKDAHDAVVAKSAIPVTASADGNWTGEYAAPCAKLGFYRVFPSLADGVTLAKLFTRRAGYTTYAVVPDPAKRVDYGETNSFFGMQGGFNSSVNIIPYLGVRWVLGGYGWGNLEKKGPGQFARDFAAARAKGQTYPSKSSAVEDLTYDGKPYATYVIPGFNGAPDWATDPAMRANQAPILPSAERDYQAFCEAAAKAVAINYPKYKDHPIQVTWEPVYPWGYKGTDKELARIYELAYPAIHKADPTAKVLGPTDGGIGGDDPAWTDRLFAAGLGKNLDGLSIHPYFKLPPERNGLLKAIQDLKDVMRKHLGHELPIYGTEQGHATKEDPADELPQAEGLVRENLILLGEGFRVNYAFYIADYSGEPGYGFYYNLHPGCDFGTDKIGPKPVAAAYAAMTSLLEGHRPTERIDWLAPTTLGYAYDHDGDVVVAAWDFGDKPREVTIPVGTDKVTVYDWMGNATEMPSPGGALKITLTPDPVYIKGVSTAVWGAKAVKPLRAASHRLEGFPGTPLAIDAQLSAAAAAIDGTLTLALDKRLSDAPIVKTVKLAKGGKLNVSFGTTLAPDAEVGGYSATLILKDKAGRTLAGDGTQIEIVPPVEVLGVAPVVAGSQCSLAVTLRDAQARPLDGTITTRLEGVPGTRQSTPFSLSSREAKALGVATLDADISPAKVYKAVVHVRTAMGYEFEESFPVDFLVAPRFTSAPAINGDLGPWASLPGVKLAGREALVRAPQFWKGDDDLSAVVKYAWDEKALYLAVDATDDVFCQQKTGFDTWNGDCLQIGIDVDSGKNQVVTGNDVADKAAQHRWSEFTMALTTNGPEVFRTGSYDIDRFKVAQASLSDIPLAVVRRGSHTMYEAAIPWPMLGKTEPPKLGDRIGVALSVNDRDDPKETDVKAVGLFGGMNGHKQMADYGVLTLGGHE